jgi:23S rRNA (cytidine1920-2'-O)/16S rRNA (cytidine1409-2'-O)-methyltransferase
MLTIDQGPPFVSRGGEKLLAALNAFAFDPAGKVCADVGASTGGFTDCLLQHGAARVYAIDVGQGILHWKLRTDPRVVLMEGTNARFVEGLPEKVDLVTIDASFISLKLLLPVVKGWFHPLAAPGEPGEGNVIALVKPQFEAGRGEVARGEGVIRDPSVHRHVLQDVSAFALAQGYGMRGLLRSPLRGPKGNAEFLAWMDYPAQHPDDLEEMLDKLFS